MIQRPTPPSRSWLVKLLLLLLVVSGAAVVESSALWEPAPLAQTVRLVSPTQTLLASATASLLPSATPPPSTPTANLEAEVIHVVQRGETVEGIAMQYGLNVEVLRLYNHLDETSTPGPGSLLLIPTGAQRIVAAQTTATSVAVRFPTATPAPSPLPARVVLAMDHTYQGINNCAPSATSMALSVYGIERSQYEMAALQKPNPSDVNVTAEEVAASVQEVGLEAFVGIGGDVELIQRLVAAGFAVMTEEWMYYDGGMGHFRTLRGYDLEETLILHNDSFYGPGLWRAPDDFLYTWKPFNNKYVVLYRPEQAALLQELVGDHWDPTIMYEDLRLSSEAQIKADPTDAYAWWGLGEALLWQGKNEDARLAFEQALATGELPWRYLWYRYGYFAALNQVGEYEKLLAVTEATLGQMGRSEDLRYHRAVALEALGRHEEAVSELQRARRDNPRFIPATMLLDAWGD